MSTATPPDSSPPASAPVLPDAVARMLDRVRWRRFGVKAAEAPFLVVSGLLLLWLAQVVLDRHLEWPLAVRRGLLIADALAALAVIYFLALRPLSRVLNRRQAALLVESQLPEFRTSLISAVDFTGKPSAAPVQSWSLVAQLLKDVAAEVSRQDIPAKLFNTQRLKKLGGVVLAVIVVAGGWFVTQRPVSGVLVQRLFLADVALPSDTSVVSISGDLRLDPGVDATLSARAEGVVPAMGRLVVNYPNGQTDVVEVLQAEGQPGVFSHMVRNVRSSFRYHFELNDGVGATHQVTVVIPPALQEIQFTQIYPAYTGLPETRMSPSGLRLLQGSRIRIQASATLPLAEAVLHIQGAETQQALTVTGDERKTVSGELTVPERGWTAFTVKLKSTEDVPSVNDPVYRVEILADQPPMVALLQPKKDRLSLLSRDKVSLGFRVTDDFGLKRLTLQYRVFRPGLSELSEATEKGSINVEFPANEKSVVQKLDWELGRLVPPLTPGCRVSCWMEAEDNNTVTGPSVSRSIEKLVDIVTEEQKRLELLELLGERARAIEKLYDMQRATNEKTDQSIR